MNLPKIKFTEAAEAKNLADRFSDEQLSGLGNRVVQDWKNDDQTREGWKQRNKDAIKLALQVVEEKSYPWPNASNVKFPLLSQASIQFQVRAYSGLANGPDFVRMRVMGQDPDGSKAARASRVSQHMNYQLLEDDEFEETLDRLLMILPIMGICYTKKYWCSKEQRLKTNLVLPQRLVVPYRTKKLSSAPRITEEIELYERQIKEMQNFGEFLDADLGPAGRLEDDDSDKRDGIVQGSATELPRKLVEQHLYLDLDGDGYSEPYTVTVDTSSGKVLRVVQRFGAVVSVQSEQIDELNQQVNGLREQAQQLMSQLPQPTEEGMSEQDIQMAQQLDVQGQQIKQAIEQIGATIAELSQEEPKIKSIAPIELYTKYGFIPAPDGSFYEIGFGSLLGPLNRSVNSLLNQLIDSGSLQNGSQGFLGKGARMKGGKINFQPYEWKRVNVMGSTLRDSIVPLPVNSPSPVLFNLLGLLVDYTKDLSSVNDAMTGKDMGQNTPAYNMQAMIEEGGKVFSGIFKRVHRSMRREFRLQYALNGIYLNPQEYFDTGAGEASVLQQDYWGETKSIYPAASANSFSQQEKMTKNQFLVGRAQATAGYDPVAVELRLLESMEIENTQEIFPLDEQGQPAIQPPKNQELEMEVLEQQRRTEESRMKSEDAATNTEASVLLKSAQAEKVLAEAEAVGDKVRIAEHEAITKRFKVIREGLEKESIERVNDDGIDEGRIV